MGLSSVDFCLDQQQCWYVINKAGVVSDNFQNENLSAISYDD